MPMSEYGWTHAIAKHPDYANKLGIITAEWSALEWHLCLLFQHLLGVDGQRAEAVFFTITNNRSRREAIASLANLLLPEGNELRGRTDRILRRVSNAATRRNSMAHAIWHFGETSGSGSTINLKRESGSPSYPLPDGTAEEILRKRLMRRPGPLRVMSLGRLDRQKGLDRLVATIVATRRAAAPIEWRVIGDTVIDGTIPAELG